MSEYASYTITQMWQMVDAACKGLEPTYDQAIALSKAQQMLSEHAQSLQFARDSLAARWPPETNAASSAYLTELDRLINAVKDTALSCAVNVFHINTVSEAINRAHKKLGPIHQEYVQNQAILAKYESEISGFGESASPLSGGKKLARGVARVFTSPTVDSHRQVELTRQALQEMDILAGAAQDGASYIMPPTPYEPPSVSISSGEGDLEEIGESGRGGNMGRNSGMTPPPLIDQPSHSASSANMHVSEDFSSSIAGTHPRLAGIASSQSSSVPGVPSPQPGFDSPAGTGGSIAPLPDFYDPTPTGRTGSSAGRRAGRTMVQKLHDPRQSSLGGGRQWQDGVRGRSRSDLHSIESTSPPRVSPPDGIIAPRPTAKEISTTPTDDRLGSGNTPGIMGTTGRHRGRKDDVTDAEAWEADSPWHVVKGVDPVIMPPEADKPIDPGPGIIGLNR